MTSSILPQPVAALAEPVAEVQRPLHADVDREADFDRHATALYRFFLVRLANDRHAADDLMQQLWLQWRQGGRHVPGDELEFWLRRVARNALTARWRKNRRRPDQCTLADPALAAELAERMVREELPPGLLEQRETRQQLMLALTTLSTADQELIVSHYFQDRSFAEIGKALSLSERAVEGRLYRARQALRARLAHLEENEKEFRS